MIKFYDKDGIVACSLNYNGEMTIKGELQK